MKKILAILTLVLIAVALAAFAAEAPAPETPAAEAQPAEVELDVEDAGICADVPEADPPTDGLEMTPVAPGGCKACKGRTWCTCSYQGKPRISCNPCCYQGALDPFPICFD